ncbi:MAG TPA: hypothetical protein VE567_07490 [Sphingomonas sp.]|nr:hypothetical protein [Sphingomonas sp.]
MADFTPQFWLILGLTLVLGWVLGLMSRSGGGRWRRELAEERRAHEAYRRDAEARIAELERTRGAAVNPDYVPATSAELRPGERIEVDEHGNRVIRPIRA